MILDPTHPLAELLRRDSRYRFEAYVFVFDALRYAQTKIGPEADESEESEEADERLKQHVTGQQLCEGIRQYALEQFGHLAQQVLGHWGITRTGDFGEIVFNLIDIGQMSKTTEDRREDFEEVYEFEAGFCDDSVFVGLLDPGAK